MRKGIAVVFAVVGILFIVQGFINYARQVEQSDWSITTATVTRVEKYTKRTGGVRITGHKTVYDIYYRYTVAGTSYQGEITETVRAKSQGETLQVKYDPAAPQNSTHVLSPKGDALLQNTVFSVLFIVMALLFCGVFPFQKKKQTHPPQGRQLR